MQYNYPLDLLAAYTQITESYSVTAVRLPWWAYAVIAVATALIVWIVLLITRRKPRS